MVLAVIQEVLEDLEAGRVVVDGEHAHADGELVLAPMPAVGPRLQLHLLHSHLSSTSGYANQEPQAHPDHETPCTQGRFLDPRNPRNSWARRMKPARSKQGRVAAQQREGERERGEELNNKRR